MIVQSRLGCRKLTVARKVFPPAVFTLAALLAGCARQSGPPPASNIPAATAASVNDSTDSVPMPELLKSIAASLDPRELTYVVNEERVKRLEGLMEAADSDRRESMRSSYGVELLHAGKTERALEEFAKAEPWIKKHDPAAWKENQYTLRLWQATAYLRMAEDQNCCSANTPDSCLVPIKGAGVHTKKHGAKNASRIFLEILKERPDDPEVRWLLNIAAMTLGDFPEGVPARFRIPPSALKSEFDIKTFPNVASRVGLNLLGLAGGAVVDDLDSDGYLDIVVSGMGFNSQLQFFHNNGNATFTERTKQAGLTGETGGLNLTHADYNNDGHPDILVLRGGWMAQAARFPCSLLHNNGDGTFTNVSRQAGLMRAGPTQAAVWLDSDNNGLLDLFVAYESDQQASYPCALYRNNGDGTFTDIAGLAGVSHTGFVKGVVSADYNNDGWPDLFLSAAGQKVLYTNNGNGSFTDTTIASGIKDNPITSFGTLFFDYNNDTWADLLIMDYDVKDPTNAMLDFQRLPVKAETTRLYRNNGNGTFTDTTAEARMNRVILGMGINFGDLDNDGFLDVYVGTGNPKLTTLIPNRMFRNAGGKYFQEVTTSGNFGHLQKGHGIAFADINNDGAQDIFEQMGGAYTGDTAYSALYANPGHGNHWVTLKLKGVQTNRSAVGARVTVHTPQGKTCRTVGSGGSFGCSPYRQEIGLGGARTIDRVEIFWPISKTTQVLRGLAVDSFYEVTEGIAAPRRVMLKSTPWPSSVSQKLALRATQ